MSKNIVKNERVRKLSSEFMDALQNGELNCFLEAVKTDAELCMEIRHNFVNIYFRGGNLCRITEHISKNKTSVKFRAYFNPKYILAESENRATFEKLVAELNKNTNYNLWIESIPTLKVIMNNWLKKHPKHERGFQQDLARKYSRLNSNLDYIVADIEYADSENKSRFDMLAVTRPNANGEASLVFVELKYGDKAMGGSSGVKKHIDDVNKYLSSTDKFQSLCDEIMGIIYQKIELGLLPSSVGVIKMISTQKPQFILLVAEHNPQSKALQNAKNNAFQALEKLRERCEYIEHKFRRGESPCL
jgi:hypothetical protein